MADSEDSEELTGEDTYLTDEQRKLIQSGYAAFTHLLRTPILERFKKLNSEDWTWFDSQGREHRWKDYSPEWRERYMVLVHGDMELVGEHGPWDVFRISWEGISTLVYLLKEDVETHWAFVPSSDGETGDWAIAWQRAP